MGNKLYVDSFPSQIEDLIAFNLSQLPNPPSKEEEDLVQCYQHLNLWAFSPKEQIEDGENNSLVIISNAIELKSIKEEHFLLSSSEVYILLLVFKDKESSIEQSSFPTGLWGIIESSSNMTPRGLMYAFPTNNSQNLESFLLSKRTFENIEYKYMLFIWNGKKASPLLRSTALMKAFDLDKILNNASLIPFVYHGYHFEEGSIKKGKVVKMNDFINNTIENKDDEMTPSSEKISNYHETVYLLKWLYPMKKNEKKKKEKVLFKNFNKNFVHSNNKTDFYDNFQYVEIPKINQAGYNCKDNKNTDNTEEEEELEDEGEENDLNNSISDNADDIELIPETKVKNEKGSPIQISKINIDNLHRQKQPEMSDKIRVPKLMVSMQHNVLNDELISERSKKKAEEEDALDEIPETMIKKTSDTILKENYTKIDLKKLNINVPILQQDDKKGISQQQEMIIQPINPTEEETSITALNENYNLKDSDRKKIITEYYSKTISEIIPGFLYLSSYNAAKNKSLMDNNKITYIINCAADYCQNIFASDPQYIYLSFYLKDHIMENIECVFYECIQFIEKAKENKGKVLVHCIQGISRSVSIIIAYLIYTQKNNYDIAFNIVQKRRTIANPNFGFAIQLQNFYQRLYEEPISYKYKPKIFACGSFQLEQPEKIVCRLMNEPFYEIRTNGPPRMLDYRGVFLIVDIDKNFIWIGKKVSQTMKDIYISTCLNYLKLLQKNEKASKEKPVIEIKEGEETDEFCSTLLRTDEKKIMYQGKLSNEFGEWNNWYKDITPKQEIIQPSNVKPGKATEVRKAFFLYPNTSPDFVLDFDDLSDNQFLLACVDDGEENIMYKWKGVANVLEENVCKKYIQTVSSLFFVDKKYEEIVQKDEIPMEESDDFMNLL